ncbi:MAG: MoaD/ThiS family protein [Candidatus Nanopelagicales bacterium]|nr:MoaD/ThiS family protein [Candidatus Nanopelagicales bacterium]
MPVTVRVPTILRTYTGGAAEVTLDSPGSTLATALQSLEEAAPGIRARVLDEAGAMRRFVNIYVDDEDVRFSGGLDTPVEDGCSIAVIPAVAGGAQ